MQRSLPLAKLATLATLTLTFLLVTSLSAQATPRFGRVTMTKQQVSNQLQRNLQQISNRSWHCTVPHQRVTIKARRIQPGRPYGVIPGTAPIDRQLVTRLVTWRTQVNGLDFKGCCISCTRPSGTTQITNFKILQKPAGLGIPVARPRQLRPENFTAAERRFFGTLLR
jgi:hypothetical protein